LKGTRWQWLKIPDDLTDAQRVIKESGKAAGLPRYLRDGKLDMDLLLGDF
jgi:hypothetical protein